MKILFFSLVLLFSISTFASDISGFSYKKIFQCPDKYANDPALNIAVCKSTAERVAKYYRGKYVVMAPKSMGASTPVASSLKPDFSLPKSAKQKNYAPIKIFQCSDKHPNPKINISRCRLTARYAAKISKGKYAVLAPDSMGISTPVATSSNPKFKLQLNLEGCPGIKNSSVSDKLLACNKYKKEMSICMTEDYSMAHCRNRSFNMATRNEEDNSKCSTPDGRQVICNNSLYVKVEDQLQPSPVHAYDRAEIVGETTAPKEVSLSAWSKALSRHAESQK